MNKIDENITSSFLRSGFKFIKNNPQIIKKIYKSALYNDEPQIYSYHCIFKDKYSKESSDDSIASGVAFDKKKALLKLIGEIVERYALTINNNKKFIFDSFSNLEKKYKNILNPEDLIPFSNNQLKLHKINKQKLRYSKLHWVEGKSIINNKLVLIPAQLVYVPYINQNKEPLIIWPISTGAASGSSINDALYRGICEIVERDSFMIAYLNKISCPQINFKKNKNIKLQRILNSLERYQIEPHLLDITTDLRVPSVAAILVDRSGQGPAVSVGLKAGFDMINNIIGALEEAIMLRSWTRDKFIYFDPKYKRNKIISSIEDRAHFWFEKKAIDYLDFWLKSSNKKINIDNSCHNNSDLSDILNIFSKKKIDIFYINLVDNELKNYGFNIVKVVIPQLQSLYLDDQYKYFGNNRLFRAPVDMGFLQKSKSENELNNVPHPFL